MKCRGINLRCNITYFIAKLYFFVIVNKGNDKSMLPAHIFVEMISKTRRKMAPRIH